MNASTSLRLKQPLLPHASFLSNTFQIRKFRSYKRCRMKRTTPLIVSNNLLEPLQSFLSQYPSLDFVAPILGLASGLTLYVAKSKSSEFSSITSGIGEWILFSSPTPFNRFVFLRCPSISFQGFESLSERLVEEDRHFVRLNSGMMRASGGGGLKEEEKLEYQRVCVRTEDGGVISIDWPANLELREEHGLDTTLLLVPGTTEGSMCESVKAFVCDALRRGFFPLVMNPRGCAASPLTTARLFTAADSDDISTAIQFISKARPWTSLMGVGWGFGANMLTKYLAEVGERTPLTAATCVNNPFDLEEATRSSPYHLALDHKLTSGLVEILQSNKELFQGKTKGFDVEKALSAKSVRDFEKAISMVSHGFEDIEDFYSKSSTREVVGRVNIPVLFIQNDNEAVLSFSTPRSSIAANPFTSLLLCSCVQSSLGPYSGAAISWCQNLAIEWLSAVELGLLKGRHPLLKDVDLTFNPKKGLTLVEGRSSKISKPDKFLDLSLTDANGYTINSAKEVPEGGTVFQSRSRQDSPRNLNLEDLQDVENGALQSGSFDMDLVKGEAIENVETESGEVIQTAQVVMNMLDVTMPGVLEEEERKKVFTAVSQGETLMKALQDAVPEDVREKLTAAIYGILHAEKTNIKLQRLLGIGKIPAASSGIKPKIQEKSQASDAEAIPKESHSPEAMKKVDLADASDKSQLGSEATPRESHSPEAMKKVDLADASDKNQLGSDNSVSRLESDHSSENKPLGQSQIMSSQEGDTYASAGKGTSGSGSDRGSDEIVKEKAPLSDGSEKGLERSAKQNVTSNTGKADGTQEETFEQDGGTSQLEIKRDSNAQKTEEKTGNISSDHGKTVSGNVAEEAHLPAESSTDSHPVEREGSDNHKMDTKTVPSVPDETKPPMSDSNPSTFNVVEALDALTGMDDSTQVAVNSVFGVIENMISQLEEGKEGENKSQEGDKTEDKSIDSTGKNEDSSNDNLVQIDGEDSLGMQANVSNNSSVDKHAVNDVNPQNIESSGWLEGKSTESYTCYSQNDGGDSLGSTSSNDGYKEAKMNNNLVDDKYLANYADRQVNSIPLYVSANPYKDYLQNEYFHRYLLSKIPKGKPLDLDTTTTLLLDYFPEEGQWKLLEQPGIIGESTHGVITDNVVEQIDHIDPSAEVNDANNYIEPSYVLLDTEKQQELVKENGRGGSFQEHVYDCDDRSEDVMQFVKNIILDALRIEIDRKLSADDTKEMASDLARDLEQVADAVALAIRHDNSTICLPENASIQSVSEKVGTLQGEDIVRAISSAVLSTNYLGQVLPVGVVIGCSLAALRKYFIVGTRQDDVEISNEQIKTSEEKGSDKLSSKEGDWKLSTKSNLTTNMNSRSIKLENNELKSKNADNVMVGAVTAALGASALLVQQQNTSKDKDAADGSRNSLKVKLNHTKEVDKVEEEMSEKNQNMAASLAEKAMSVAGPVVPTREDGEVDQERLVAMLADLGQKGGLLRLVGKLALLWGGIRGAVSLTDRLISFLHVAERPLYQRIIGFAIMVLVLWSPVIVPLLPTLVQSWTTSKPSRFAELGSIIGLYAAVTILVMLWGKRIRGYEDPLEEYGLDLLKPPKIQNFFISLMWGVMIVLSIQSINALLGCVCFSWPSSLHTSLDIMSRLRACTKLIILAGRGIITATSVVLVEELLFRAWLPEEIASDLGYHQGIIISGLAFSLLQRSLWAIPGLWLFSFALAGFRQRSQGSLSIPIGLRAGIMASSFILQTGGFLTYKPNYSLWVTGSSQFQPFGGIVGLVFSSISAIILYPRQPLQKKKTE